MRINDDEDLCYNLDYNANLVEGSKALDDIEQTLNELMDAERPKRQVI